MIRLNTPVEYYKDHGLWVKREDLSCDGPRFSKTRGVLAHIRNRPEQVIGVLDTAHSQGGWAVARACRELGKECHVWFPWFKGQVEVPIQQVEAERLGATLHRLKAGRSAILYHSAKRELRHMWETYVHMAAYMMPNALKLPESVAETADELVRTHQRMFSCPAGLRIELANPSSSLTFKKSQPVNFYIFQNILVSCSSGTLAAGVAKGLAEIGWEGNLILHMGYDRSAEALFRYIETMSGVQIADGLVHGVAVNEGFAYKDKAMKGAVELCPFPCNEYYDLKAFAWWITQGRNEYSGETLMWNIG